MRIAKIPKSWLKKNYSEDKIIKEMKNLIEITNTGKNNSFIKNI